MSMKASNNWLSTLLFYIVFLGFFVAEGFIVVAILAIARDWFNIPRFGAWLAWFLFVLGGMILAVVELRVTHKDQKVRDPILKASCWLQNWDNFFFFTIGFLIATLLFGPMASAVALKKSNHSYQITLCFISAILFATVWVPIFVLISRS